MNENFGVKMSQEYDHSICQTAKKLLQAQNTQDYKKIIIIFLTLQSSLCKFNIYKSRLNHVGSLKIDKKRQIA